MNTVDDNNNSIIIKVTSILKFKLNLEAIIYYLSSFLKLFLGN